MSALVRPSSAQITAKTPAQPGLWQQAASVTSNIIPEAGQEKILDCLQK